MLGQQDVLEIIKEWFDDRLAVGTTKNINTMAVFLTLAYLYEEGGCRERRYLPWLEEWGEYFQLPPYTYLRDYRDSNF